MSFSEYGFDNSNKNRIVAQSEIAKVSFYKYFEDKKDLYFHLMDTLLKRNYKLFDERGFTKKLPSINQLRGQWAELEKQRRPLRVEYKAEN